MMKKGYNERLFYKKDLRSWLHYARFYWLEQKIRKVCPDAQTVLELGCFDGKTIDFLPKSITAYHGYDANWENGLDVARQQYASFSHYQFTTTTGIHDFNPPTDTFDVSICMETMEHLFIVDLEDYIYKLEKATKSYCIITVPNEKGIVFLLKYLFKTIVHFSPPPKYSFFDIYYSTIGKMNKVKRKKRGHKGFDYAELLLLLAQKFDLFSVEGIPFGCLPASLNFTIGIVLKKRNEES